MDPRKAEPYLPPNYLAPYYYPIYFLSQPADFVHPFYFYVQANPYVNVTLPASSLPQNNDHQSINVSRQELPAEFGSMMRQNNDRNNLVNTDNTPNFLKRTEIKPNTQNLSVKMEEVILDDAQYRNMYWASPLGTLKAAKKKPFKPRSNSEPRPAVTCQQLKKSYTPHKGQSPHYLELEKILNNTIIFHIIDKDMRICQQQIISLAKRIFKYLQKFGMYSQSYFKASPGWLEKYLTRNPDIDEKIRNARLEEKEKVPQHLLFNSKIWEQFAMEELKKNEKTKEKCEY